MISREHNFYPQNSWRSHTQVSLMSVKSIHSNVIHKMSGQSHPCRKDLLLLEGWGVKVTPAGSADPSGAIAGQGHPCRKEWPFWSDSWSKSPVQEGLTIQLGGEACPSHGRRKGWPFWSDSLSKKESPMQEGLTPFGAAASKVIPGSVNASCLPKKKKNYW